MAERDRTSDETAAAGDEAAVVPIWPRPSRRPTPVGPLQIWISVDSLDRPPTVEVHHSPETAVDENDSWVMRSSASPRLIPGEPLGPGLQRVALLLLDHAVRVLSSSDVPPTTAVHEARKAMKRTRAVLRLVRDRIGQDAFRAENAVLRDTARRLSGSRDAAVLLGTLADVVSAAPSLTLGLERFRAGLDADRIAAEAELTTDAQLRMDVVTTLRVAMRRYEAWPSMRRVDDEFAAIEPGIRRVYRRGRRGLRRAIEEPTVERIHDFRKRVKYLRYQLEVLRRMWPPVIEATAGAVADLAELLGHEHDLAVFGARLAHAPAPVVDPAIAERAIEVVARRRIEAWAEARRAAARVYAESPRRFTYRLERYWSTP